MVGEHVPFLELNGIYLILSFHVILIRLSGKWVKLDTGDLHFVLASRSNTGQVLDGWAFFPEKVGHWW